MGLELIEAKNRQVRRMTATIGHPTLRLIRVRIGNFWLGDSPPGGINSSLKPHTKPLQQDSHIADFEEVTPVLRGAGHDWSCADSATG